MFEKEQGGSEPGGEGERKLTGHMLREGWII